MSFLVGLFSGIHSIFKDIKNLKGNKISAKSFLKAIRKSSFTWIISAFLFITILFVLIGGAIYSVTGAVGELFNSLYKMWGSSEPPSASFYSSLSDETINSLVDKTGASLNPKKIAKYMDVEAKSVPSSIQGKRITKTGIQNISSSEETTTTDVTIDTSCYVNKFKTNWEFISAVDLAKFTADNKDDTTAADSATTLYPKFEWVDNLYRTTIDTSREWQEIYEYDPTTRQTKQIDSTYNKSLEKYSEVKEPVAIPSKVTTMFGDYNYTINKDVVIKDDDYCTPYITSSEVTTRQEDTGKTEDDKSQPIYDTTTSLSVRGERTGSNYKIQIAFNGNLLPDRSVVYHFDGRVSGRDVYKYSSSSGNHNIYIHKNYIPENEVDQDIKYVGEQEYKTFTGRYKQKKIYKTITITKNMMKTTKQKIIEDQKGQETQVFDPTIFIQYLNSSNLSTKDLDLVKEILLNIPSGNYLIDNIQRIMDGDYGDIGNGNLTGGASIGGDFSGVYPTFIQWDDRWKEQPYSGSTIGKAGCGVTSMAMAVCGLGGDISKVKQYDTNNDGMLDPSEVAVYATRNGHSTNRQGTAQSLYADLGSKMGLKVTQTGDTNAVYKALGEGKCVVTSVHGMPFTHGSHLILLIGVDSSGKVLIHDPNSVERSQQSFDFNTVKIVADNYFIMENPNVVSDTFTITSYYGFNDAMQGGYITATGVNLADKDLRDRIIAVNTNFMKYHSKAFIFLPGLQETMPDGTVVDLTGYYTAEDTGGAFTGGAKKIDIYAGPYSKSPKYRDIAYDIGTRQATVKYRK